MDSFELPHGVVVTPLHMHRDHRGWFTEIFRDEWGTGVAPCQWSAAVSEANVLRGVHVHVRHRDYLVVLRGRMSVGLHDLRPDSPTYRKSALVDLSGERLSALRIPTRVAHGFYAHEPSMHVYGVDGYFDPADELGCHWADPALGLAWPCSDPLVSERDGKAPSLAALEAQLAALGAGA